MKEVIQLLSDRRNHLADLLRERKEDIDLSRQHQVYGAWKELELVLETLHTYQEIMMREQDATQALLVTPDKRPLMRRMKDAIRDKIID